MDKILQGEETLRGNQAGVFLLDTCGLRAWRLVKSGRNFVLNRPPTASSLARNQDEQAAATNSEATAKQRRTVCSGSFWHHKVTGATRRREIADLRFAWNAIL